MKRLAGVAALLAFPAFFLAGQEYSPVRYDTKAEIMADITKASGEYRLYDFDLPAPTPPPRGYKPFYITHYGRHGSRYALSDKVYEGMKQVLEKARADGKLTPAGEELCRNYLAFYPRVAFRGGELTRKGQEQHRRIAALMYRDCRPVFKGKTHVEAISTNSPRVLMSMAAFLDELGDLDKSLDAEFDAGRIYLPTLLPASRESPAYRSGDASMDAESKRDVFAGLLRTEAFCVRFFNDTGYLEANYGMRKFQNDLRTVIVDIPSLDFVPDCTFDGIFTDEELYNLWKYRNYNGYLSMGRSPSGLAGACGASASTVQELLAHAEEDIAGGRTQLRLRFGHDSGILPLLAFMRINSFGIETDDPEEVENYTRSFEITMAANVQFIFYRSRRNPEILVKCLFNGRNATLPFAPVEGPYYSWTAFKDYYAALCAAAAPSPSQN